jgi:hypothetical protein
MEMEEGRGPVSLLPSFGWSHVGLQPSVDTQCSDRPAVNWLESCMEGRMRCQQYDPLPALGRRSTS